MKLENIYETINAHFIKVIAKNKDADTLQKMMMFKADLNSLKMHAHALITLFYRSLGSNNEYIIFLETDLMFDDLSINAMEKEINSFIEETLKSGFNFSL